MAWVRLEEGFAEHPKVAGLNDAAFRLWVCAIAYCNRQRTDGAVSRSVLRMIAPVSRPFLAASRLVEAGLWSRRGDDFVVHDYLEYQPSRAQLLEQSAQRAKAGQAGGLAKAKRTASKSLSQLPEHDPTPIRPDPSRPVEIDLYQITDLSGLEAWGFDAARNYGQISGAKAATLRRLLPIPKHELEAAAATSGRSWGYFAKVIESYREEALKPSPGATTAPQVSTPSYHGPAQRHPEDPFWICGVCDKGNESGQACKEVCECPERVHA